MLHRRELLKGLLATLVGTFGTAGYALAWEPRRLDVVSYKVTPVRWTGSRSLRIAAVSDLHIGGPNVGLDRVEEIVARINGLDVDLVLLLGDFIASRTPRPSDPTRGEWASRLARLRSRHGIYAILGNHDWWHDPAALAARRGPTLVGTALEEVGIPVLDNRAIRIETDATPLWLAGLGDQVAFTAPGGGPPWGADDLPRLLGSIPDDGTPVIMMAHEPDIFARMPNRIALTLSGHTHGGQLRILGYSPFVPSRYGNRYAYGQVREGERDLIVSGGVGTSRIPLRLGVPPEILLIEVGAGSPAPSQARA